MMMMIIMRFALFFSTVRPSISVTGAIDRGDSRPRHVRPRIDIKPTMQTISHLAQLLPRPRTGPPASTASATTQPANGARQDAVEVSRALHRALGSLWEKADGLFGTGKALYRVFCHIELDQRPRVGEVENLTTTRWRSCLGLRAVGRCRDWSVRWETSIELDRLVSSSPIDRRSTSIASRSALERCSGQQQSYHNNKLMQQTKQVKQVPKPTSSPFPLSASSRQKIKPTTSTRRRETTSTTNPSQTRKCSPSHTASLVPIPPHPQHPHPRAHYCERFARPGPEREGSGTLQCTVQCCTATEMQRTGVQSKGAGLPFSRASVGRAWSKAR